jgi:hypothetical protein
VKGKSKPRKSHPEKKNAFASVHPYDSHLQKATKDETHKLHKTLACFASKHFREFQE